MWARNSKTSQEVYQPELRIFVTLTLLKSSVAVHFFFFFFFGLTSLKM